VNSKPEIARPNAVASRSGDLLSWRLLNVLNLFRMLVGGLVMVLYFGDNTPPRILGDVFPGLFLWTGLMYFSFGVLAGFALHTRRPGLELQIYAQLVADVIAVTLLMHSSGGATSGLGSLLFVTIAVNSVLLTRRMAIAFAALATLAILGEQTVAVLYSTGTQTGFIQAGIIGIILFAAGLGGHSIGRRLRESEQLAEQRGVDLANLSQINDYVIRNMRTGVMVVDEQGRIRMLNSAAAENLKSPSDVPQALAEAAPRLKSELDAWRQGSPERPTTVISPSGRPLIPHFASIGGGRAGGALIFLEDASSVAEQVRQTKLATLGRLTASIAHEIRNPLAAVSHANQLLAESPQINGEDRRLTEIISEHAARVERMVENILQLSRRENTRAEELDLVDWLKDFIGEFRDRHALPEGATPLSSDTGSGLRVRVDPTHLHQIIWNLSENALRHGGGNGSVKDSIHIEFRAGSRPGSTAGYMEVLDRGPGVPQDIAEHIFEPFYTSDPRGTGLGLFIARELCECNRARLSYAPRPEGGSCFRIDFGASDRWLT